jgi:hypothetical protein
MNLIPLVIGALTFIVFIAFAFYTSSSIEQFIDKEDSPKEAELRKKLTSITSRLCPIQEDILVSSAQSNQLDTNSDSKETTPEATQADITTTLLQKCLNSELSSCINNAKQTLEKPPTKQNLKDAMIQFIKEADGPLFMCSNADDIYKLTPNTTKELALSGAFFTLKIMEINKLMSAALRAEPVEPPQEDPWANLDNRERIKRQQKFMTNMKQLEANEAPPPTMNDAEKDAFLTARLNELNALLEQKDSKGVSVVENTLSVLESQYKILKKTKQDAKDGTLVPQIPDLGNL